MSSHSLTYQRFCVIYSHSSPARFISLQSHPFCALPLVSRSYPMFGMVQINSCPCSSLQSSLFWTQQLCLGPHLSLTQVFINNCLLCSHGPYSIQCYSYTLWEHNARELGCFCLNLSWARFLNCLSCWSVELALLFFLQVTLLPDVLFLLLDATPSMHHSISSPSFAASNSFLGFALQPTIFSSCCSINAHHPSARSNCIGQKQV